MVCVSLVEMVAVPFVAWGSPRGRVLHERLQNATSRRKQLSDAILHYCIICGMEYSIGTSSMPTFLVSHTLHAMCGINQKLLAQ